MELHFDKVLWNVVIPVAALMVAAIIHEIAHGYAALRCGDQTAKNAGRLTLNPLAHLDPFGSIILPLMMTLAGGGAFAFAKPVPYNPNNLKNPERDELIVALAGPASNLAQALVATILFRIAFADYSQSGSQWLFVVVNVLSIYIYVNLMLMFFNLIPFPPLDGSAILSPLFRGKARSTYYNIQRYAMPVLIVVMYVLPSFIGFNPISKYLNFTAGNLYDLLLGF